MKNDHHSTVVLCSDTMLEKRIQSRTDRKTTQSPAAAESFKTLLDLVSQSFPLFRRLLGLNYSAKLRKLIGFIYNQWSD